MVRSHAPAGYLSPDAYGWMPTAEWVMKSCHQLGEGETAVEMADAAASSGDGSDDDHLSCNLFKARTRTSTEGPAKTSAKAWQSSWGWQKVKALKNHGLRSDPRSFSRSATQCCSIPVHQHRGHGSVIVSSLSPITHPLYHSG
ncbi:uncharacterized protein LOC144143865 [Haemaphysalis longicornis]